MPRVKRGYKARQRRKKVLKMAAGFRGRRKNTIRRGQEAVEAALKYAYRDRRQRKRQFRSLWITRISGALEGTGLSYNRFIAALKQANIGLDRKILANLAVTDPKVFGEIVKTARPQ